MLRFLRYSLLILCAFIACESFAQVNTWRDVYKVKKKDTIYGIARMYGITIQELMDANPEMKADDYKLKKGTMVFIPFEKKPEPPKPVQVERKAKTVPGQTLRVGVMLPLHDNDGDGKRMTEYYRGLLVGCDSLRQSGINTEVHAWNVPIDADIRTTLLNEECKNLDIIFGPLYTRQVNDIAEFCRRNEIKLVIPFSTSANDVKTNPQVYQVYENGIAVAQHSIDAYLNRFTDCNPVIIDCNDTTSNKGVFTFELRKELEKRGIEYHITNLKSSEQMFAKAFSTEKRNMVMLNTGRSQELNLVFRRLNELRMTNPSIQISMFGYPEWISYEPTFRELYHRYDAYVPTTYYYYKALTRIAQFERNYQRWFGVKLQDQYIPRFALTGYDHAQFFLRGLFEKGSAFQGIKGESTYKPLQTPLHFQRTKEGGGMQNIAFRLMHYRDNKVIETISY